MAGETIVGAVLDRPVWHALTGRQASLAVGDDRAWRFDPACGPFAAARDGSDESLAALAGLCGEGEIWLAETAPVTPPPGMSIVRRAECLQMVAESLTPGAGDPPFVPLGDADADEMLALATLTVPGPFLPRTNRLGGFVGIRERGRLVAMAGERMKPGRFTEISGVCTHPDHRGRGYAGFLMRVVAATILARGEVPILHSYASNVGANALYESLGFRTHQSIELTVLTRV